MTMGTATHVTALVLSAKGQKKMTASGAHPPGEGLFSAFSLQVYPSLMKVVLPCFEIDARFKTENHTATICVVGLSYACTVYTVQSIFKFILQNKVSKYNSVCFCSCFVSVYWTRVSVPCAARRVNTRLVDSAVCVTIPVLSVWMLACPTAPAVTKVSGYYWKCLFF